MGSTGHSGKQQLKIEWEVQWQSVPPSGSGERKSLIADGWKMIAANYKQLEQGRAKTLTGLNARRRRNSSARYECDVDKNDANAKDAVATYFILQSDGREVLITPHHLASELLLISEHLIQLLQLARQLRLTQHMLVAHVIFCRLLGWRLLCISDCRRHHCRCLQWHVYRHLLPSCGTNNLTIHWRNSFFLLT